MFSSQIDSDIAKLETQRKGIKIRLTELMDEIKGREAEDLLPDFRNMERLRELDRKLDEDESRLKECAHSIQLVKLNFIWSLMEAWLSWAYTFDFGGWCSGWKYGYLGCLLNLMVMLKLQFTFVELNGLRNWQAHKLLGSLLFCPLDILFWCFFNWTIPQPIFGLLMMILAKSYIVTLHIWNLWDQYLDMKKPRPIVSNLGAFPE